MMYVKQLRPDGSWEVKQLDPSQHNVEGLLHDLWQANGWADATEEEYDSQIKNAEESVVDEPLESVE